MRSRFAGVGLDGAGGWRFGWGIGFGGEGCAEVFGEGFAAAFDVVVLVEGVDVVGDVAVGNREVLGDAGVGPALEKGLEDLLAVAGDLGGAGAEAFGPGRWSEPSWAGDFVAVEKEV
jgi:hypothetical protein